MSLKFRDKYQKYSLKVFTSKRSGKIGDLSEISRKGQRVRGRATQ
jgi:hypothetical protein